MTNKIEYPKKIIRVNLWLQIVEVVDGWDFVERFCQKVRTPEGDKVERYYYDRETKTVFEYSPIGYVKSFKDVDEDFALMVLADMVRIDAYAGPFLGGNGRDWGFQDKEQAMMFLKQKIEEFRTWGDNQYLPTDLVYVAINKLKGLECS